MFFENTQCLSCGRRLAFLPEKLTMLALEQGTDGSWQSIGKSSPLNQKVPVRLCGNYTAHAVCNWALDGNEAGNLCRSCTFTHTIPDLERPGHQEGWAKLETAKRRLLYTLYGLELPLVPKQQQPDGGLEFQFLSDSVLANGDRARVLTGHDDGVITINVAEADDVYREEQRRIHHEQYRTLLGHFRHEVGHYYWDRLVSQGPHLEPFRQLFGDERADYQMALNRHYEEGAPADWDQRFISAYASMHPWEDWAETWAHVMHMVDSLETSYSLGLVAKPPREGEPVLSVAARSPLERLRDFDRLLTEWGSLTYILNNLTRGLGQADAYPFVINPAVIEKLRFVAQVVSQPVVKTVPTPDAAVNARAPS